jgi:hypothetical protein
MNLPRPVAPPLRDHVVILHLRVRLACLRPAEGVALAERRAAERLTAVQPSS